MKTIIESSSPTFVATFADGTITRITTNRPEGKPEVGLGVRLSRAAYESRRSPPAFTAGHFETPPNGLWCSGSAQPAS
jgi:hypothetical protein